MKNRSLKLFIIFLILIFVLINSILLLNFIVDPYFHYRKPYSDKFNLQNQRYQNDGILKHFDYDALIIGTSMCENFKVSELDNLFNCNAIKTCFSGAGYKEINENIKVAIENNEDLKTIVRCLDYNQLLLDEDYSRYNSYPTYLYDDTILNDYKYLLNKDTTSDSLKFLLKLLTGKKLNNSFDDYSFWGDTASYGKESVMEEYTRVDKVDSLGGLTDQEKERIKSSIKNNVLSTINLNINIEYYIFFSPYSILFWDDLNQQGELQKHIEAEKIIIEMLLECSNVKLFSFFDDYSLVTDLNNYKDPGHYSPETNSQILTWMKNGKGLLTKANYENYINNNLNFYLNYNYEEIFVKE